MWISRIAGKLAAQPFGLGARESWWRPFSLPHLHVSAHRTLHHHHHHHPAAFGCCYHHGVHAAGGTAVPASRDPRQHRRLRCASGLSASIIIVDIRTMQLLVRLVHAPLQGGHAADRAACAAARMQASALAAQHRRQSASVRTRVSVQVRYRRDWASLRQVGAVFAQPGQ